ncbi:MAG: hypothetical protein WCC59_05255 [Terriglobales bacterium]
MRVTIEDLTDGILGLCVGGKETLKRDLQDLREGCLKGVDEDVALGELFMLRGFLAAYAVQTFFSTAAQHDIREAFNRGLHRMLLGSGNERIKAQPNVAIDEMNKRYNLYLEAIHTPHQLGPAWNVGKVFAGLCGRDLDVSVVMVGSVEFGGAMTAITDFLSKCKQMDGGDVIDLPDRPHG